MLVATGTNPLLLTCTTSSSNPASNIVWKNASVTLLNSAQYKTFPGEYNGVVRSQTLTLYPTRDMDGDIISCEGSNTVSSTVVRNSITLDLLYRPVIYSVVSEAVLEGNYSLLECSASSKPPSTYKWYKEDQQHVLFQGNGSADNNRLVYNMSSVSRTDAGTYRCKADNGVETPDSKTTVLTVLYPPDVIVDGSNTTVMSNSTQLTCSVPDTYYTYGEWIQEWPGYGIVSRRPAGQTLTISSLTYEHSGIYRCSASNGIKVFGTGQEYMEGSLNLLVKSFPVKAYSDSGTENSLRVTGRLQRVTSVTAEYYSFSKLTVACYNVLHGSTVCPTSTEEVTVHLKVFSHIVPAPGVRINISINIDSEEDFGTYNIEVTNDIGRSFLNVDVVNAGPPETPQVIQLSNVSHNSVSVTWQPAFHGGFNQTVVVQLSMDSISWIKNVSTPIGTNGLKASTTLKDLDSSKTYYLRMFAYNKEGRSKFTETYIFSTTSPTHVLEVVSAGAVAGGISGGFIAGALSAVAVVLIIVRRKRGYVCEGHKEPKVPDESSSPQYESLDKHEQGNVIATYSSLPTAKEDDESVAHYYNTDRDKAYVNIHVKET